MGRNVTGTWSIYQAAKEICRLVGRFGTLKLQTEISPEFALAVGSLVAACGLLELVDDQPYVTDRAAPSAGQDELDEPV